MPRRFALVAALTALAVPASGAGKKAAPPPPPAEVAVAKPKAPPTAMAAACPRESLAELDGEGLVQFLKRKCRTLNVPVGSAPTDIADDDVIVAACVRDREAVDPRECDLKAQVVLAADAPTPSIPLLNDGELAIAVRGARIYQLASPANGARMTLSLSAELSTTKSLRSALVFRRPVQPYGGGAWLWLPMPMFTTDFSSSTTGYRFGITPVAVGLGTRFFPSSSRAYVGTSLFLAWNLLIPNDTQTLSNGTTVRVNYKAFGAGFLLDLSGWLGVGVGVGHTFTSDARTDFRGWILPGPKLLAAIVDW